MAPKFPRGAHVYERPPEKSSTTTAKNESNDGNDIPDETRKRTSATQSPSPTRPASKRRSPPLSSSRRRSMPQSIGAPITTGSATDVTQAKKRPTSLGGTTTTSLPPRQTKTTSPASSTTTATEAGDGAEAEAPVNLIWHQSPTSIMRRKRSRQRFEHASRRRLLQQKKLAQEQQQEQQQKQLENNEKDGQNVTVLPASSSVTSGVTRGGMSSNASTGHSTYHTDVSSLASDIHSYPESVSGTTSLKLLTTNTLDLKLPPSLDRIITVQEKRLNHHHISGSQTSQTLPLEEPTSQLQKDAPEEHTNQAASPVNNDGQKEEQQDVDADVESAFFSHIELELGATLSEQGSDIFSQLDGERGNHDEEECETFRRQDDSSALLSRIEMQLPAPQPVSTTTPKKLDTASNNNLCKIHYESTLQQEIARQNDLASKIAHDKSVRVVNIGETDNVEIGFHSNIHDCDDDSNGSVCTVESMDAVLQAQSNLDLTKQPYESEFVRSTLNQDKRNGILRRTLLWFCLFVAIILILSACVTVYLLTQQKESTLTSQESEAFEDPLSLAPTATASAMPTVAPTITPDPFELDELPPDTVFTIMTDTEAPQTQAWNWIQGYPDFSYLSASQVTQKFALATLYYATNGDASWEYNMHWLDYNIHECSWFSTAEFYGNLTVCHDDSESYQSLVLATNKLQGSLPAEIGLLSTLHHINVGGNELEGPLPENIFEELGDIQTLNLFHNRLSGTAPTSIGKLSSLRELQFQANRFEIAIPSEMGLLTGLQTMDWSKNLLTSSLPVEIGLLANLEALRVEWNSITGPVPSELGNCESLVSIMLSNNQISGALPPEISELTQLRELWAYNNDLTGSLPSEFGTLDSLKSLNLIFNQLGDTIPTQLFSLSNLEMLHLSYNRFSGSIPDLGGLSSVQYVYLNNNLLESTIPSSIGQLTMLEKLNLKENLLKGGIGSEIGSLSSLTYLDVGYNELDESLPTELGRLKKLECAVLSFNQIRGALPSELGELNKLDKLDLTSNLLESTIPTELGWLSRMKAFLVTDNLLTGVIPTEFGELWSLEIFDVNSNALVGGIPSELGQLSSTLNALYMQLNLLSSSLPSEIGLLTRLEHLVGWNNELSGSLPTLISGLSQLKSFDLYMNPLNGTIPVAMGELATLEEIWLSATHLTGPVPSELGALSMLQKLYLQKTSLSGPLPEELSQLSRLSILKIDETQVSGIVDAPLCDLDRLSFTCSASLCGCDDCACPA